MTKKTIALCLALMMAFSMVGSATAAKKKKKKKPKPYESTQETIVLSHPVFNSASGTVVGVTAQEFLQSCSEPASNGLDAFVWELPAPYTKVISSIQTTVSSTASEHDVDLYLFDAECNLLIAFNSTTQDETGVTPKGTAWILVHNYLGGPVDASFKLTPQ